MQPILDKSIVGSYLSMIDDIATTPTELNVSWLRKRNMSAVPVVSGCHFDKNDILNISSAAISIGCHECLAIATEPLADFPLAYRMPTTIEGISSFNGTCGHFNFILIPEDQVFAILCTTDEYFIVAGSRHFIEVACGSDIMEARERFYKYATSPELPKNDQVHLVAIADKYNF